eukprot:CAMPEP_0206243396 /NCGR_PEP_ID=MMETSP0047_2-20121206/17585_1 /ASSEMBLY_ACC=CAM_ASM_000192 /TAXON_ID=195065 /ORGANISM="Chroomonas mesostigmatica_cf, Strain CCMP1168" /LENGTH=35 /DNA_ID= /DNA_START= /DNA_END= /DNA_ORIENTATION=
MPALAHPARATPPLHTANTPPAAAASAAHPSTPPN